MYINHNSMATGVANNLTGSYSNLATSTQRLSSGLRVNSAADDAAGLAIRELMRADIASLDQGVRNANDAISLIQTADGALGIIDEKLIRMKELAEQASTGTYDSTQRLMIESEYQAMASEITRIANATDFNGIKLLNGNLSGAHDGSKMTSEGELKVHFGPGNDSAEDYYYIGIEEMTSQALGVGNASTWQDVQARGTDAFKKELTEQIKNDETLTDKQRGELLNKVDEAAEQFNKALNNATDYKQAHKYWGADASEGFMAEGKEFPGNSTLMNEYMAVANAATQSAGPTEAADIETKINNAINALQPQDSEVAAGSVTVDKVADMWTKVENTVMSAAKEAGFNDKEIDALLHDDTNGIKKAWDTAAQAAFPAGTTAIDDYDALFTAATGAVTNFMTVNHADLAGSDNYGDVIARRNETYNNYANAASDAKPAIGPTRAEEIAGELKTAFDKAWADATEKLTFDATGAGQDTAAVQAAAFDEAIAAVKKVAIEEIGMTEAQWTKADIANGVTNPAGGTASTKTQWDGFATSINANIAKINTQGDRAGTKLTNESLAMEIAVDNQAKAAAQANDKLDQFWNGLRDTEKQKLQYAWGQAAMHNLANADTTRETQHYGIQATDFDFKHALGLDPQLGDTIMKDNDMLTAAIGAAHDKTKNMDFAGYTIETQEDAQQALNALTDAITQKDKTRAHLGALQNRLENTVSNLTVQSENLQAAESRISDVDVAKEMTNFVRNQILTQSAVAMLSQANSMPQMAMQLIH